MLCEDCQKRPACVHITKVINNHKSEKHLCEQCAHKNDEFAFGTGTGLSVQDFLKGMFSHGLVGVEVKTQVSCPHCKMTYQDFSQHGKIGCASCYAAFADRLDNLLRRIHGANVHTGKIPRRSGGLIAKRQTVKLMRKQLDELVQHEEYEKAAKLRDEIRQAEKELEDSGEEGTTCQ